MGSAPLLPAHAIRLVTVAEMQQIERAADAAGHSFAAMMERAGAAVADEIRARHGPALPNCLVLVGPGNNGGDGLVCARHLAQAGAPVRAYLWRRSTEPGADYENHFASAIGAGVQATRADADPGFEMLLRWLDEADVVVDALLGTGAGRPIEGELAALLDAVALALGRARAEGAPHVVAVDCPSGLNCDTGQLDPHALAADLTVTFAYAKRGHYRFPGTDGCGSLVVRAIGIEKQLGQSIGTFLLTPDLVREWLPLRPRASHKGTFGKLIGAVGSVRYPGAVSLSLAAAARAGAGLVTGAVPEPILPIVAARLAEPTWLPLPATDGALDAGAAPLLRAALAGYDALFLGCGLMQTPATAEFVRALLESGGLPPTLIDADGLNCLARIEGWPALLPAACVLTPHPAELARLLDLPVAEVMGRRWELASEVAARWQAVVLVKGPYTVIAAPTGALAVLPIATPALATAGTGDVLSGTIAGLMAQGVAPFQAACAGAWLHGTAGLLCEAEIGAVGPVAGDLLVRLPAAVRTAPQAGHP